MENSGEEIVNNCSKLVDINNRCEKFCFDKENMATCLENSGEYMVNDSPNLCQEKQCNNDTNFGKKNTYENEKSNFNILESIENPKRIWGKLVYKLRELGLITLYTACGEIRDVCFEQNKLIVKTKEEYLYKILTKEQNKQKIDFYLKEICDKISVEFLLLKRQESFANDNLKRLQELFGKDFVKTK